MLVYYIASYIEVDAHIHVFSIGRVYIQNLYVRSGIQFLSKSGSNINVVSNIFDIFIPILKIFSYVLFSFLINFYIVVDSKS